MAESVESKIKDLEQRLSNAEIRHKRLQAEFEKSTSLLLKSIGKQQAETYQTLRLEMTQKAAAERKKTEEIQKKADAAQKALQKQLSITQADLKKLLR